MFYIYDDVYEIIANYLSLKLSHNTKNWGLREYIYFLTKHYP